MHVFSKFGSHVRLALVALAVLLGETGCYGGVVGGTTYTTTYSKTVATYAGSPSQEIASFGFNQEVTYLMNGGAFYGSNTTVLITNVSTNPASPLCFNYVGTASLGLQSFPFTGSVNGLFPGHSVEREVGSMPFRVDLSQFSILFTSDSQSIPGTAYCD
jgi:hypothetical protein